ncbi:hypothetical protein C7S18_02295 [Ahniella affigens]|uniref:Secreted protein n=1 Tax=Ahniella affigens TaxID=2021234 RepID=A0A2P1PMM4_9GAMM|nr:hypothetical protein [Ahniella affigens]AVP96094.1 hypothetical protein C7S18_02295 [Ahniella affigens]
MSSKVLKGAVLAASLAGASTLASATETANADTEVSLQPAAKLSVPANLATQLKSIAGLSASVSDRLLPPPTPQPERADLA